MSKLCKAQIWEIRDDKPTLVEYLAYFLQWGLEIEEKSGNNYTVGIIQLGDGRIATCIPQRITMLDICNIKNMTMEGNK